MKKIISIDLDGVLNTYNGNFKEDFIPPMREGAKEFIAQLSKDYRIEIFTTRNKKIAFLWLQENNLLDFIFDITNVKNPLTSIFIDDRAIAFNGNFIETDKIIKNFQPFWK